jgi:hypothetical protein
VAGRGEKNDHCRNSKDNDGPTVRERHGRGCGGNVRSGWSHHRSSIRRIRVGTLDVAELVKQHRCVEKDGGHAGLGEFSTGHKSGRAGQASTHRTEVVVPTSMDRGNSDNAVRHTTAACTTGACHNSTIRPDGPEVGDLRTSAPEWAQIPESATAVAYDGWTGMQTIYLRPKKKKRKPCLKKKEDTDESSDVDDRGWTREREAKLATLQAKPQEESQAETSGGAQEEEEPANGTVEGEEME